jgi:cytochrome P450
MHDFDKRRFDNIDTYLAASLLNLYYPWIIKSIYLIPSRILAFLIPEMKEIDDGREEIAEEVEAIRSGQNKLHETSGHRTIFHCLLQSNLPPQEKARNRLRDEALSVVSAGFITTAFVCKCITYHVMANPDVHEKLLQELKSAMPVRQEVPPLSDLEKLPYLGAVIHEGLRISDVIIHRLQRILSNKTLNYKGNLIPPGTILGMSTTLFHGNENVFPDPGVFKPERWLVSEVERQRLQKHLISFSRGTRACIGINLAWAELYLVMAIIFRRFEFDIAGVSRERDIDVDRDLVLPVNKKESKGVIVKVHRVQD